MKDQKDNTAITVLSSTEDKPTETTKKSKLLIFIHKIYEFAKEDTNRVAFCLKVGLAVLLVSLLILIHAPYRVFGTTIIWSILTVAVMFEYTVGATFQKGVTFTLGSLLASVLAIGVGELALATGPTAEPIVIGISIFMIGTITSFMKLWPTLVPYEYGFRVLLFTYCLIIVSGYRMGNPITTSIDRVYSILIGAFVTILVNTFIFPIWAGDQLHKQLVKSFSIVADSLEECVKQYLDDNGSKKTFKEHEPSYISMLNSSSSKLESLALLAKWEPPHGRFCQVSYPWSEYVKVGTVLKYCAYEVMTLHGVLHSHIQEPNNIRFIFGSEILEATRMAAELVRSLGNDIRDMKKPPKSCVQKSVHGSIERLQGAIVMYLISNDYAQIKMNYISQMRSKDSEVRIPKVQASQSIESFTLITFTSMLIEFFARLDNLVEAVNELSEIAEFKFESP